MGQIGYLDDVPVVAQKIVEARQRGDVTVIGRDCTSPRSTPIPPPGQTSERQ